MRRTGKGIVHKRKFLGRFVIQSEPVCAGAVSQRSLGLETETGWGCGGFELRDRVMWGARDFRWVKAGDSVQGKDAWTGMKC